MADDELATFPLGVCLWSAPRANSPRTVQQPSYVREILRHAGLCYRELSPGDIEQALPSLRILLTVGEASPPESLRERLHEWIREGGTWISIGGVCEMPGLFGVIVEPPAAAVWGVGASMLGEGYLESLSPTHPVLSHVRVPLHFFNGVAVTVADGEMLASVLDAHQRPTPRVALAAKVTGKGSCLLIAPDVTGTIVRIQQGISIACDGVPAPDGTGAVCDEVLKSDDGAVLDWHFDRQSVAGVPGLSGFLEPAADLWREVLLRTIFYLADRQRVALPLLWLYPRNLPAVAHLSHDTDLNDVERAGILLETLRDAGIHSTWCTILPGYPPETLAAIRDAGHELAMHYDALDAPWSEAEFDAQWRRLTVLFDGEAPVTNKNHYLRWENYTEFYGWCARRGIRLDQSKGVSKTGEVGFNFGTCHLYFPVDRAGTTWDVLELATPTQDLNIFAPAAVLAPLLETVVRRHGILHLLFHPAHIHRSEVVQALREAVRAAREQGLEWWTGRQLSEWENARRQVVWSSWKQETDRAEIHLTTAAPLPEMTLLWLAPGAGMVRLNDALVPHQTVERWGFAFQSVVFDAAPRIPYRVAMETDRPEPGAQSPGC